ncbi:MAG: (Fe-S)-binding protein, partial [Gemmatimonadales bacterium]|nr:(Fe-S)-binding protein [Gemmatimonadales bacterium]
ARGPRSGAPLSLRVLYDPPCHLLHAQRITEAPEAVLRSVPGIERVCHTDADLCCGSAGSYSFAEPGVSNEVLALKVEAIRRAEPDLVVSGNPGCIMQIGAGLRAAGLRIPVLHPIELLDWSYERAGFYET